MASRFKALSAAPILGANGIDETLSFYEDVLGFETIRRMDNYAIVKCDSALIHFRFPAQSLSEGSKDIREIYIEVEGVEELWQRAKVYADRFKMRELFDQPYGMTEFHVIDPNGILIFVGEASRT